MSTNCRRCGVKVDSNLHNCPLCGAFVNEENTPSIYEYPQVNQKDKRSIFIKICAFLSVIALAVNVAIDVAVNRRLSWSIHVLFGLALVWIAVGRPAIKGFNIRKFFAWIFASAIALLFYINAWVDKLFTPWAFTLGAPIVVLVWATALEIMLFAHKAGRADYQIALTKLFAFSILCVIISLIAFKKCEWGWLVCTARGFVDVLSLSFFAKDAYFSELKKRLHV